MAQRVSLRGGCETAKRGSGGGGVITDDDDDDNDEGDDEGGRQLKQRQNGTRGEKGEDRFVAATMLPARPSLCQR